MTAGFAGCEESRGSIEGKVLDANGQPAAGVTVRAERGGQPGVMLQTDDEGYYIFNINTTFD